MGWVETDMTTPFGEPWGVIVAVSDAAALEPSDAAEMLRVLAVKGFRVVPVGGGDDYESLLGSLEVLAVIGRSSDVLGETGLVKEQERL